jgi:hypothetical protein
MEWDLGQYGLFYPEELVEAHGCRAEVRGTWVKEETVRPDTYLVIEYKWQDNPPKSLVDLSHLSWENFSIDPWTNQP